MNFGYSDFRLRTCELKAPQCFLIEKLIDGDKGEPHCFAAVCNDCLF